MQVSVEDGIGGGDVEARVVGQKMQISVKDVDALATPKSVQEQVQIGGKLEKHLL
jgi:hypothetical protein